MQTPFKDTEESVVVFLYNEASKKLDAQIEAKERLDKKFTLYLAFCLAYIAFVITALPSYKDAHAYILTTICIQLVYFTILLFANFKSHEYAIPGIFPNLVFTDEKFSNNLKSNISSLAKTLNIKINKNHKKHQTRAKCLDIILVTNYIVQIVPVLSILKTIL
ncbi:hypothetical protein [Francisella philomiragia]|uniref:Uncharacterized protein n=1 Tax=Francisella philomiragia TaxID=28110 RepID=A0ABS1GEK0_9GAMM|nr:hypothetical protein [Francisella philomiragia]MBK2259574.1 hypothetical protein [Francisella philomiragia]MBK2303266.1 hypothetical protein [Francisella philomiragia]